MKIIVAGGRDFDKVTWAHACIISHVPVRLPTGEDTLVDRDTEIVSGGAKGADQIGEWFAEDTKCKLKKFPANWEYYGKSAGFVRNKEMADYADMLVAFWDGKSRGTKHMIDTALKGGLEVHVYRYLNEDA